MHRAGRRAAAAALAAAIALQCLASVAQAELQMAYAVVRHGARNYLPLDSTLSDDETAGGPTLLPEGQRQLYNAGGGSGRRPGGQLWAGKAHR
jgi:hypothetical protein